MRIYQGKYDIDNMYRKYRGIPRPKNVEETIKNYYKTNDKNRKDRLYEYILLERKLAENGKIC